MAYVRLRGLRPRSVGRLSWWLRLSREVRPLVDPRVPAPTSARSALRLVRAGFFPSSSGLYELEGSAASDYVSDRQREFSWEIALPATVYLDDKLAFFFMLRQFGVPTPNVPGTVIRGRAFSLGGAEASGAGWLRDRLDSGRLIVRPIRGGGGSGVWLLARDGEGYRLNGAALSWPELEARVLGLSNHLVTEFAEQAAYAREIFAAATNTLRIITMRPSRGPAFIAAAVHRFGTPASAPADNWSQGGLSALIDEETGVMGTAVARPAGAPLERHAAHPATGAAIAGARIPGWEALRDGILAAATRMSFLPYVGWDVIVTDDGFSVIEGNRYSNVRLVQVHKPLLTDPRVRAFFTEYGLGA